MDKVLVCERGDLVFVFNFHPTNSYTDYRVGCRLPGDYKVGDDGGALAAPLPVAPSFPHVLFTTNLVYQRLVGRGAVVKRASEMLSEILMSSSPP